MNTPEVICVTSPKDENGCHQEKYLIKGSNVVHRDDGPAIIYYHNDHPYILHYYQNSKLHRDGGPAEIVCNNKGMIYEIVYYKNDLMHRDDGPALIKYEDRRICEERYYCHGRLHRDGGPAKLTYNYDDKIRQIYDEDVTEFDYDQIEDWWLEFLDEIDDKRDVVDACEYSNYRLTPYYRLTAAVWYKHGKKHHDHMPAVIIWQDDGVRYSECWYQDGEKHRLNGPAELTQYDDYTGAQWVSEPGMRTTEWYYNGKLHRLGGPAYLEWDLHDGTIMIEGYYYNGLQYNKHALPGMMCSKSKLNGLPDMVE